jgi:hypothetical protein
MYAPRRLALLDAASRSGLLPDCEIARNTTSRRSVLASYREESDGAADEVSTLVCDSIRYLANVAA